MDRGVCRQYSWYLKKNKMSLFHLPVWFISLFRRKASGNSRFSFGQDPDRDWKVLLASFFVIALVAVGMSIFVYTKVDQGEIFLVDKKEVTQPKVLDRFQLEKTVSFFESRNEDFLSLKRQPLQTLDPFIPVVKPKK